MKKVIIITSVLLVLELINRGLSNRKDTPTIPPSKDEIFQLVNDYRVSHNLKPLVKSESLCTLAKIRVIDLRTDYSHDLFKQRVKESDLSQYETVGENLDWSPSSDSSKKILSDWDKSPKHKELLLGDYEEACVEVDMYNVVLNTGKLKPSRMTGRTHL